nr:MAG TPA: hypothetical protein [Caudoviricetes sp.]DAS41398.1 MAG TPA: hypothetical protein [Bacteriophage sp.]DAT20652.1 MAG TPA: hypothetical protein [Caudoviricetes sp.]
MLLYLSHYALPLLYHYNNLVANTNLNFPAIRQV